MDNPYQAPSADENDQQEKTPSILTQPLVFWVGICSIFAAMTLISSVGPMLVLNENAGRIGSVLKMVLNGACFSLLFLGVVALIVCHWFPHPERKYSWRRKSRER